MGDDVEKLELCELGKEELKWNMLQVFVTLKLGVHLTEYLYS